MVRPIQYYLKINIILKSWVRKEKFYYILDENKNFNNEVIVAGKYLPLYDGKGIFMYDHRYNKIELKKIITGKRKFSFNLTSPMKSIKNIEFYYNAIYYMHEFLLLSKEFQKNGRENGF